MAGRLTASILEYCDNARTAVQDNTIATASGIDHVRPPAQPVMAKQRAQNELHIQHEDREQGQGEKTRTLFIEFHSRNFFHPPACR